MHAKTRAPSHCLLLGLVVAHPAPAEGPYRNRDNKDPKDLSEGTYPIPYQKPTVEEITEVLQRVHAYVESASPTSVVDSQTGREITDFSTPNPTARIAGDEGEQFYPLDYTMGVTHSGMLLAGEVTGDAALRRLHAPAAAVHRGPAALLPRASWPPGAKPGKTTFGAIIATGSLDDSGSMCAALVKARRAGRRAGPEGR